jgi:hypothetical protein
MKKSLPDGHLLWEEKRERAYVSHGNCTDVSQDSESLRRYSTTENGVLGQVCLSDAYGPEVPPKEADSISVHHTAET